MAMLNKTMLIGRLTKDPDEVRVLPNTGDQVIKFRLAVGRSKKNASGQWENDPNPLYIDCEVFSRPDAKRNLVEVVQKYCKRGDQIYIEGRLKLDEWTDKATNTQRSKHKIVVESIEFLGGSSGAGGGGEEGAASGGGNYNRAPSTAAGRPAQQTQQRGNQPQHDDGGPPDDGDIPF